VACSRLTLPGPDGNFESAQPEEKAALLFERTPVAVLPIVLYPDPLLLRPTRRVEQVSAEIRELVRDMMDTMYAAPGVGLAANQVGAAWRLLVVDLTVGETPGEVKVLVNPEIRATEGSQTGDEGCLSFPDITLEIERPFRAEVTALDLDGNPVEIVGEGLMARALMHEIEHLDGETFLRNVSPLKRELVKRQIRKRMKSGEWVAAAAQ
jgi:peptide deformylase